MLKIRLTRLGAKKLLSTVSLLLTHVLHVKVVLLTLLVNMMLLNNQLSLM